MWIKSFRKKNSDKEALFIFPNKMKDNRQHDEAITGVLYALADTQRRHERSTAELETIREM